MGKVDDRNRTPAVERLPDSRLRITRWYDLVNYATFTPAELTNDVWLAWGTPDVKFTSCRLIKQETTGQHPAGSGQRGDPMASPERHPSFLTRVFEEMDANAETAVGNAAVHETQDGLIVVTQDYIQLSTGTAVYGVVGSTLAPAPWSQCVLKDEERTDDGTLRRIKRTYINKGLVNQSDEIRNEGALLIRTLTYVNDIPPTPSGFTLIRTHVEYPNGNPVRTYTFAKGNGVIEIKQQPRDGGLRLITWVSLGPTYDPAYMLPPGVLMIKDEEFLDGTNRYTVTCMQNSSGGNPTVGTALSYTDKVPFRYPGRAKVYSKGIPAIFGSNSSGVGNFTTTAYDVWKSPPVDQDIDGTVEITYGTSNVLNLGTAQYWNPTEWATAEAAFQPTGTLAVRSIVEPLLGYRAINAGTAMPFTAGSTIISFGAGTIDVTAYVTSCMGTPVYGLSSGFIVVYGGPDSPEGIEWVISAKLQESFMGYDGTRYYRQTVVKATPPAQPALPV